MLLFINPICDRNKAVKVAGRASTHGPCDVVDDRSLHDIIFIHARRENVEVHRRSHDPLLDNILDKK